ncbi:MAG: carbohydrate kinase [Anaerolineaceae bacterium]|nr:carbohydrate kinase [Anaerolineaceae bacterium]
MAEYDVIVLGDSCVDLIVNGADVVPEFGQVEKLVDNYTLEMGGSCCIFAAQAAKLGLRVGILGRVGDDAFGALLLQRLKEAGVDTQHMVVDPVLKTGLTIHLTQPGDRAMLTHPGSLNALTPAEVTDSFLASARHIHYGSLFLHTGLLPEWTGIIKRAKSFGLTVSLDTNWDPDDRWEAGITEALPLIDIFLPNEQEALRIARLNHLEEAVAYLRKRVNILALKRGSDGANVYQGDQQGQCAVEAAVAGGDGIGAGDSFDAGFVSAWLRGLPINQCLEIACLCGRSVAGQIGGFRGQPLINDIALFQ